MLFLIKLPFQSGISFEPPARNPVLPRLRGQQASSEASFLYHQKYVAAAATSISMSLRTVKQMTEILEKTEEEEDLENEGLDEGQKLVRQLSQLRNTKVTVASILGETALPMAAYGVKFLAKIFGDLTLSKLFSHKYFCVHVVSKHSNTNHKNSHKHKYFCLERRNLAPARSG